jgi:hypothetical protein
MEIALALRSPECSLEDVLLPALDELFARHGPDSAAWAFAAPWGGGWLRRVRRLVPRSPGGASLLIGDASRDELDPDYAYIRALEFLCARAGVRLLCLSVRGVNGIAEGFAPGRPDAIVLAGNYANDDEVARWTYAVRATAGPLPVALYHRHKVPPPMQVPTTDPLGLPPSPIAARHELLRLIELSQLMRPRPIPEESSSQTDALEAQWSRQTAAEDAAEDAIVKKLRAITWPEVDPELRAHVWEEFSRRVDDQNASVEQDLESSVKRDLA